MIQPSNGLRYFVFELRLLGVPSPPRREFAIRDVATFKDLHLAIQRACDWDNCHLYAFRRTERGKVIAGIPDDDAPGGPDPDAALVKLRDHFKGRTKVLLYNYDFGDDWWVEVRLLEQVELAGAHFQKLLGGERAFPKEDCGGIYAYQRCIACVTGVGWDPSEGEDARSELLEWLDDWHPDQFDLKQAARAFDA